MSFNGYNSSQSTPVTSPGPIRVAFCWVRNPYTGAPEMVPATDPPQGEVFFRDIQPVPVLGSIQNLPYAQPLQMNNPYHGNPPQYDDRHIMLQMLYGNENTRPGSPPPPPEQPRRQLTFGTTNSISIAPATAPLSAQETPIAAQETAEESKTNAHEEHLNLTAREIQAAASNGITTANANNNNPANATEDDEEDAAAQDAAAQDAIARDAATRDAATRAAAAQDAATRAAAAGHCQEGGTSEAHEKQQVDYKMLGSMLSEFHTSVTKPWVTRLLIHGTRCFVHFDTLDQITISADVVHLGNLMKECQASYTFALECHNNDNRRLLCVDHATLGAFFRYTQTFDLTGKLAVANIEWMLQDLKITTLNIHKWKVTNAGRLGSLTHTGLPLEMENLYFDARGTDNTTFIDNIQRLYADTYVDGHGQQPFLKSLTLVCETLCTLGDAFRTQLDRIEDMLQDKIPSSAAVITSVFGNDDIHNELRALEFQYSHTGFVESHNGKLDTVEYWKRNVQFKTFVLGFRAKRTLPMEKEDAPVVRNL